MLLSKLIIYMKLVFNYVVEFKFLTFLLDLLLNRRYVNNINEFCINYLNCSIDVH